MLTTLEHPVGVWFFACFWLGLWSIFVVSSHLSYVFFLPIFHWLLVLNGIKSAGKVVCFTALFPYVILFILIGRGVTLPGAYEGLMFYLKPDFNKLKEPSVWFAAANQLVFN